MKAKVTLQLHVGHPQDLIAEIIINLVNPSAKYRSKTNPKAMAKLNGILSNLSGSIADLTFRRTDSGTVVSQKVAKKSRPIRTVAIMTQRCQWANIINLYKRFEGKLHPSFESKARNHSDYNEFVSANMGIAPIFLKKGEAVVGGCVVAPYQVTRGSLPSVQVSVADDKVTTDIAVGGYTIDEHSMLGEFSQAIVSNNPGFQDGDQISVFNAVQSVDPVTGVPVVKIICAEVTLDSHDEETTLYDLPGVDASTFASVNRQLGINLPVKGGIAYVHSRTSQGGTKVSTQRFVCDNELIDQYNHNNALFKAIESYGGLDNEQFLTPNVAA